MDPHSPALGESLLAADLFGSSPVEVLLVGVTGECYNAGCELSPAVKNALQNAVNVVLEELERLNEAYSVKSNTSVIDVWWSRQEPVPVLSASLN